MNDYLLSILAYVYQHKNAKDLSTLMACYYLVKNDYIMYDDFTLTNKGYRALEGCE